MPVVQIEPTREFPLPYSQEDEEFESLTDEMAAAGNTAELQVALGAPIEVPEGAEPKEKALLDSVINDQNAKPLTRRNTAYAAAAFLRQYGSTMALDVAETRSALTNKLLTLANCGDPKFELKAIELLGKHSDISLFTNRSEVTINYKDPEDLEKAIKERVRRLLNANVIDITPAGIDLDDELGVFDEDGVPVVDSDIYVPGLDDEDEASSEDITTPREQK